MKKVFAFLSTLLLTIAFIGLFATNSVKAAEIAEGKWVEDPNLLPNEDPVYVMGSIYSTYPAYYDNDAVPDEAPGAYIYYPWNETRLRMAQFDAEGNPTDRYWAVYFAAGKDETYKLGAGYNILFWDKDASGNVVAKKSNYGVMSSGGSSYSPSLSTLRTNISGQDLEFDPWAAVAASPYMGFSNDSEITGQYDRTVLVFDGQGRVIRGLGDPTAYTSSERTSTAFGAEYCYVDGVGTRVSTLSSLDECDKLQKQVYVPEIDPETGEEVVDPETGEVVLVPAVDENNNPVYEDTDQPRLVQSRFVWEWSAEQPTDVNENGYLGEGWNPDLWDDCYQIADGGWIRVAFVQNVGKYYAINDTDELEAYAKTLYQPILDANPDYTEEQIAEVIATAKAEAKGHKRQCVRTLRIPAGGYTYTSAYLDNKPSVNSAVNNVVVSGLLYGRKAVTETTDAEGNVVKTYTGQPQTFNFTAPNLEFENKVIDNKSYQLLEGQQVVEVMQGEVFVPSKNINYDPIKKYWQVPNDLSSFKDSEGSLDFNISVKKNGGLAETVVEPPVVYSSMAELLEAFYVDLGAYINPSDPVTGAADAKKHIENRKPGDLPKAMFTTSQQDGDFLDVCPQWRMLFEGWLETLQGANLASIEKIVGEILSGGYVSSAYQFNTWFPEFLFGYSRACYLDGGNEVWLKKKVEEAIPSIDAWNAYSIDTSLSAPGDYWNITYKVTNKDTGNSSSMTVKYVVVDSYTPILEVGKAQYNFEPKLVGEKYVADPIDKFSLVKAYDGQYNGVDIKGNDISQYISFETELNWDKPASGTYEVKATIRNNAGTKSVTKSFIVKVLDKDIPLAIARNVTILQGQDFHCLDGIVIAYDVVDGDLTKSNYKWWSENSNPVDTTQVKNGKAVSHTIVVEIIDSSKNSLLVSYKLTVVPREEAAAALKSEIAALDESIDELNGLLDEIYGAQEDQADAIEELKESLEALTALVTSNNTELKNSISAVKDSVDAVAGSVESVEAKVSESKGCGSGSLLVIQIASACALLALVLRKRR